MPHEGTRRRRRRRRVLWPYLYALPAVGAMAFAFGFPLVQVVRDSFYAGSFGAPVWVGLDNFKGVIADQAFRQSLLNNLKLLLAVPVMLGLGLAIALVLNDRIRGMRKYQAIVFLPYVLPATAIGIAFSFLLQQNGVLNTALRQVHLRLLAQDWLGNSHLAIVSVGGLVVWQQLGFGVVVSAHRVGLSCHPDFVANDPSAFGYPQRAPGLSPHHRLGNVGSYLGTELRPQLFRGGPRDDHAVRDQRLPSGRQFQ